MSITEDEVDLNQFVFIMGRKDFQHLVRLAIQRDELKKTMQALKEETRNILGAVCVLEKELNVRGDYSRWEYQKVEHYA